MFDQQTMAFVTNPSLKNKDMYLLCNYVCTVYTMQRGTLLFSLGEIGRNIPYMILLFKQLGQIVWKMQDIGYFSTKKLLNLFFQKKMNSEFARMFQQSNNRLFVYYSIFCQKNLIGYSKFHGIIVNSFFGKNRNLWDCLIK